MFIKLLQKKISEVVANEDEVVVVDVVVVTIALSNNDDLSNFILFFDFLLIKLIVSFFDCFFDNSIK